MKALLPVAGSGTRMYPLGVTTPKCLLTVLNKPILLWSIEALVENGIDEIVIVISAGKFGALIREYVQSLSIPNVKLQIAVQEQQLGTAHVVQSAKSFFTKDEEFVFIYGDDLYGSGNIRTIMQTQGLAIMGKKVSDPEKWGILEADDQGYLKSVVEKPATFVGDLANIGCMKLSSRVFDVYENLKVTTRGEFELTDTLSILLAEQKITVLPTNDYWIPIGYPWHLLEATEYFITKVESKVEGEVEDNVTIKGTVVLPKSSRILAGTYIEGNIVIGEHVQIGPNAHLRGAVVIANDCKVGFSVEIKNSIIGKGTQIPHLAYVGDSILGNNVNYSGQCITANLRHDSKTIQTPIKGQMVDTKRLKFGAVIGDDVRLGVGTMIYPGRKIWPGVTTRPGQVVEKDITT